MYVNLQNIMLIMWLGNFDCSSLASHLTRNSMLTPGPSSLAPSNHWIAMIMQQIDMWINKYSNMIILESSSVLVDVG
jgi:hypothetical protein